MTPEKIVEKLSLEECKALQFDVDIIESKATFSKNANRYLKSRSAPEGISDIVGNDSNGIAVFIELKAKGKLKTLRPKQREFLIRKIESCCFAVVIDNPENITKYYLRFLSLPKIERQAYLKSILP